MNSSNKSQSVNERIRAYLDKCPGAISGSGGHAATFSVACGLRKNFDLSEADLLHWLTVYNQTCQPPWSEGELRHKAREAMTHAKGGNCVFYAVEPVEKTRSTSNGWRFTKGTKAHLQRLADSRPYFYSGLELANERGLLVFGNWHGNDVYGVTDQSKRSTEIRRMDGNPFPAVLEYKLSERKSHAIKGSEKKWPVGILESKPFPAIALVEGIPDFLEAHYYAIWEGREKQVAVVAMLSGAPEIHADALPHFAGKVVRIFPHVDKTGLSGAEKWRKQLIAAGALHVDLFDFSPYRTATGEPIKDFYQWRDLNPAELQLNPALWRVMP